jgi:hypothetical protein
VAYTEVATKLVNGCAPAPTDHFVYGDGGGYFGSGLSFGTGPFRSVSPQISPADQIPFATCIRKQNIIITEPMYRQASPGIVKFSGTLINNS